jgi:hypothetical protein
VHLRIGDEISYLPDDQADWRRATVISRAGKATGQYKNWYNIRDKDTDESFSIDLGNREWLRMEEANIVMVPRSLQSSEDCKKAKSLELEKLESFEVYELVDRPPDVECITCRWIVTYKGNDGEIRARLVARGFQEQGPIQVDAPTVSKSVLRLFTSIVSSKGWKLLTTDIKSAFLQGEKL